MKNVLFPTLFVLLLISSCRTAPTDCKRYFEGTWKYKQRSSDEMYVVRTLDKQIEYIDHGKYHYDFDIKWIDGCSYEIVYRGTNNPKAAIANVGEMTTVEITQIDEKEMSYQTKFRGLQESGEMTRIK